MSLKLDNVLYVRVPADLTAALSEAAQREVLPVATWARQGLAREVNYYWSSASVRGMRD
jgi:predicted HicB family RNase H-like nuclease